MGKYTEKEIIENALAIAEFEGYETYNQNGYDMIHYSEDNERTAQDTAYHNDWNWLLPVASKLSRHKDFYAPEELGEEILENDIDAVYTRVYQTAKWILQNEKKSTK